MHGLSWLRTRGPPWSHISALAAASAAPADLTVLRGPRAGGFHGLQPAADHGGADIPVLALKARVSGEFPLLPPAGQVRRASASCEEGVAAVRTESSCVPRAMPLRACC